MVMTESFGVDVKRGFFSGDLSESSLPAPLQLLLSWEETPPEEPRPSSPLEDSSEKNSWIIWELLNLAVELVALGLAVLLLGLVTWTLVLDFAGWLLALKFSTMALRLASKTYTLSKTWN